MNRQRSIVGFLCAFLVTLFVLQWNGSVLRSALWTIVLGGAVIGCFASMRMKKQALGWTFIAISIGIAIAMLRITQLQRHDSSEHLAGLPNNTKTELQGWISDVPDRRPTTTQYVLMVRQLRQGTTGRSIAGTVLITDRATWPEYAMGDFVSVKGAVAIPKSIEGFDYAKYLSVRGIDRVMDRVTVTKLTGSMPPPWSIRYAVSRHLFPLRVWFERQITRVLPEPHASLLIGLLTGGRSGLPADLSQEFRTAGLSHIVAISGYNITIILTLLSSALFFIPIKKRFWPLSIGITLFVIFVGAGAPVVRAGIMGVLGLIAIQADRIAKPRQLILWTAFFMSAWNPRELWYDPGFQLSFLATIGIAELGPFLKRGFSAVPESFGIRESLAATIAAEIATLPVTMLIFRQLSLVAPLSNLLVAPLIPMTMLTGFIATLLGAIYQPLGLVAATVVWALLSLILGIVHLTASIPLASLYF